MNLVLERNKEYMCQFLDSKAFSSQPKQRVDVYRQREEAHIFHHRNKKD